MRRARAAWRDEGPWLALLLLPLAALGFRRGWLLGLSVGVLILPNPAHALSWADLWARPDQRTVQALTRGDWAQAVVLAPDPRWRGTALYRNAEYEAAARAFGDLDTADAD